jgi:hypothetical protein
LARQVGLENALPNRTCQWGLRVSPICVTITFTTASALSDAFPLKLLTCTDISFMSKPFGRYGAI